MKPKQMHCLKVTLNHRHCLHFSLVLQLSLVTSVLRGGHGCLYLNLRCFHVTAHFSNLRFLFWFLIAIRICIHLRTLAAYRSNPTFFLNQTLKKCLMETLLLLLFFDRKFKMKKKTKTTGISAVGPYNYGGIQIKCRLHPYRAAISLLQLLGSKISGHPVLLFITDYLTFFFVFVLFFGFCKSFNKRFTNFSNKGKLNLGFFDLQNIFDFSIEKITQFN